MKTPICTGVKPKGLRITDNNKVQRSSVGAQDKQRGWHLLTSSHGLVAELKQQPKDLSLTPEFSRNADVKI